MLTLFAEINWTASIIGTIILCIVINVVLYVVRKKK
jgi:hypothetical protein